MHWGHLIILDFVHWREVEIALRPTRGFDSFGTWSGTTLKNQNDKPEIFYTGVNGIVAGIGQATPKDDSLILWQKYEDNPVIARPPENYDHLDFRDPYVWEENGTFYMIIGSGLKNEGGGILFTYKSNDLINWSEMNPLYSNEDVAAFGHFWEMPTFSRLNEEVYLLQITPTPQPDTPARSVYLLGNWAEEKFDPYFEKPKSIELFNSHLLAPAFGVDENTSDTYIGIIPEDRDVQDQIEAGWRQTFSLPRQVRLLSDSAIGQIPHPNLCRLRSDEKSYTDLILEKDQKDNLPDFGGNQIELEFEIAIDSNAVFDIEVLRHEDNREFTRIGFNIPENTIELDRTNSTLSVAKKDIRTGDFVFNPEDTLQIRIFIDHSTLEVFIQNLTVFSARIYPSRESSDLVDILLTKGEAKVLKATQWQMDSIIENTIEDIACLPENLPDAFNKPPVDKILGLSPEFQLNVYPNPCYSTSITVESGFPSKYCIRNLFGQIVQEGTLKKGINNLEVGNIGSGMYLIELYNSKRKKSQKIILNQIK